MALYKIGCPMCNDKSPHTIVTATSDEHAKDLHNERAHKDIESRISAFNDAKEKGAK